MAKDNLLGLTGGRVLHELLANHGVKHIFGYPGGAALPLLDGLFRSTNIEFILAHHEQGAGHMAEGYARASGNPGVALVTSGPGTSNIVTPMLNALLDGTPLVVICGEVSTDVQGTGAFQEIDVMSLARTCTKWCTCVQRIDELTSAIHTAFHYAKQGRQGPTLVAIPKDIAAGVFDPEAARTPPPSTVRGVVCHECTPNTTQCNDRSHIEYVARLINGAHSPVICAGNGVLASHDGPAVLREIAERACIPVATTLLGLGCFDQEHPLSLGMVGMYGSPQANRSVQNADVIIALGARLDERAVGNAEEFGRCARVKAQSGQGGLVQFDIKSSTVGHVIRPTELIIGDLSKTLPMLLAGLKRTKHVSWLGRIAQWKQPESYQLESPRPTPEQVMEELNRQTAYTRKSTIISTGVGQHQMWAAKYFGWRYPRTFISSCGLGTMGFGLPAAIGAKLARPECEVVDVDGDASFCMSMEEFLTAAQYGVAVKVIVFNNQQQAMIAQIQKRDYGGRECFARQKNPDFVMLAQSMGCEGLRCSLSSGLSASIHWLLRCRGPALLEVILAEPEMAPTVPPLDVEF
ncbi:hypothetical protein FE257_008190 [Aspergillus nanangensis]|uniref:Acetolactate synthase n=1 Tax=Aspergillus nanangensis TaxID=2582783 RepID=A0AAD4GTN6_ASPNN|nr:hypothetical protein FE257_008190 [Aspergillus nanangensis]